MAPGRVRTTDAELDAALERARQSPDVPRAMSAEYNRGLDVVVIRVDNGHRLVIPREEMQGLENATEAELSHIEIFGGLDIAWPALDVDHYLLSLMDGVYSSERWKASREKMLMAA